MNKKYVLLAWGLLKDAKNPDNTFGFNLALEELFHLIELNRMDCLEDYIAFKDEWYSKLKNKSF
jgi:hypothetical protein